ncbi:hypothetical protein V2G26_013155 [Clonostachys chloroleuca]
MTKAETKVSQTVEAVANEVDSRRVGSPDESPDETQEAAKSALTGWALASLTVAFMSICFVLALDNTILATAIPQITSDFNSLNDIGWYGSSYLIAQMALLPTCGRIYACYNIKWVYCLSLVVFELGSIISAVAPNSIVLIVGRAITGMGAAGLVSGTTTILAYSVALKMQAKLSPVVLGMYNIGSTVGPLVGGAITDNKKLTWRFVFWINLPFGVVGLALVWFTLGKPPPAVKGALPWTQKMRHLDIPGAILLLGATVCLNLALQWGGIVYPWSDSRVFGCLIGLALILLAFLGMQYFGKENATIPLHLFANRTAWASFGFMMLVQTAIVLQSYFWPLYFQSVRGDSARDSGVKLLPLVISNSLGMLAGGWTASKTRHYVPLMWIGAPLLAVGGGLYQLMQKDTPAGPWIGYQIISGASYGMCSQMPILAVQVVLSKADIPTGLVVVMFFQMLGGALAPAVGQNLLTDKLLRNLKGLPGVDGAAVVAAGGKGFTEIVPPALMDVVLDAYNSALKNVFWVGLATPAVAWVFSWMMEWRQLPDSDAAPMDAHQEESSLEEKPTNKEEIASS